MGLFNKGLKNEFETAVVNEPSVFEPLKFNCISVLKKSVKIWGFPYKTIPKIYIRLIIEEIRYLIGICITASMLAYHVHVHSGVVGWCDGAGLTSSAEAAY